MRGELEGRIGELARGQHGVVSRAQLLEIGLLPGAVQRRVQAGRLRPLHRGVYLVGPLEPARAREMAAALACGPAALVGVRSAAALRAWIPPQEAGEPVVVVVPGGGHGNRPGIRVRFTLQLEEDERAVVDGIPVTSVGRTIADLASVCGSGELERAVAVAERERMVTRAQLEAAVERYARRPGIGMLRALLSTANGPAFTRSEGELLFLALVREARLPEPQTNVRIAGYEIDFFWPDHRIAVEFDGYRHHGTRIRFESDRRRAAHLAALGIQVIPLTWRQIVEDRTATIVRIGQALSRAERR